MPDSDRYFGGKFRLILTNLPEEFCRDSARKLVDFRRDSGGISRFSRRNSVEFRWKTGRKFRCFFSWEGSKSSKRVAANLPSQSLGSGDLSRKGWKMISHLKTDWPMIRPEVISLGLIPNPFTTFSKRVSSDCSDRSDRMATLQARRTAGEIGNL